MRFLAGGPLTPSSGGTRREAIKPKRFFLVAAFYAVALVLVFGCNRTAPTPARPSVQTAGGMTITLTTLPSPPHSGDDTLIVTLTDAGTNAPIGNAWLRARPARPSAAVRRATVFTTCRFN